MPTTTLTLDQWVQVYIGGSSLVDQAVQINSGKALISLGTPSDATTAIDSSAFDDKVIYVPAGTSVFARPNGGGSAVVNIGAFGAGQSSAGYEMFGAAAKNAGVVSNPPAASTKKLRAARARVRTKAGRGKVLFVGDSTTAGAFAAIAFASRAALRFSQSGTPAVEQSVTGHKLQANTAAYLVYDPRFDRGAWGYDVTRYSIGAAPLRLDAASGSCTFTPSVPVDTFVIRYMRDAGYGSIGITIGGSVPSTGPATVNASGTAGWQYATVKSAAVASQALVISKTASGGFFIGEIYAYDSTVPAFDFVNGGWPTSRTSDWNVSTSLFSPLPSIAASAADLIVIGLGINDWDNNVPLATFTANYTAIVQACRAVADVLVIIQPQTDPSRNATATTQKAFTDAISSIATANGCMLFDFQARAGDFASANGAGLMADMVHPNALGYSDWGDGLADLLGRL